MPIQRTERREWARSHMVGLEGVLLPSFTPDLKTLDEDGIRWDVQLSIRQGFFGVMCACESGLTLEENKRFLEIAADEAAGRITISLSLLVDTFEDDFELLRHAERVGCDTALMGYPQNFWPTSQADVERVTRELCEATNLGIILYATERFDFGRFHPSSIPFEAYDRLADIPNVVGMKVGFPDPGTVFECFRRYGDRLLVNMGTAGLLGWLPVLRQQFGVQWGGAGMWEMWQSPDKPYVVEYFDLVMQGKFDEAMKVYWALAPAQTAALAQLGPKHGVGGGDLGMNHWPLAKYAAWCVGGNGGLTRQPAMRLQGAHMRSRKAALRAIGIEPREPDEEFFVGRVNYARGVRSSTHVAAAMVAD